MGWLDFTPNLGAKRGFSRNKVWDEQPSLAEIEREDGPPTGSPASVLFTDTQRRLLGYLYGQPDRAFRRGELLDLTGVGEGAAQRELARLEGAGLIAHSWIATRKYYQADERSIIHAELLALVQNSFGLAEPIREAFSEFSGTALLFVHETITPSIIPAQAIELMMVVRDARPSPEAIRHAITAAEQRLARGVVLPRILGLTRLRQPDVYEAKVLAQPRIWVLGSEARLGALRHGSP